MGSRYFCVILIRRGGMAVAQFTTEAIVLGTKNWGDADKIIQLFSRERGKLCASAFGCRRPKSPLAGPLQMFQVLDITLSEGERVDTVRQASVKKRFPMMSSDLNAMAYGAFIAELTLEMMPEDEPQEAVYDWLLNILAVCGEKNPRIVALAAGWQLLPLAGVGPKYDVCAHCRTAIEGNAFFDAVEGGALCPVCAESIQHKRPYPEAVRGFLQLLAELDFGNPPSFHVKKDELLGAESLLLYTIDELIGKRLKSVSFLSQMGI